MPWNLRGDAGKSEEELADNACSRLIGVVLISGFSLLEDVYVIIQQNQIVKILSNAYNLDL